jgi:hypothetical protein
VLRPVELHALRDRKAEDVGEEAPRAIEVGYRERHRPRDGADIRPRALSGSVGPGVVLHQLDQHAVRISEADASLAALAYGLGGRLAPLLESALDDRVEVVDPEAHGRIADVARTPVGRQRADQRTAELEQLDLEEVLAVD